jgi:hypothetical protein
MLLLHQFVFKLRVPSCRRPSLARRELYGTLCLYSVIPAALLRDRSISCIIRFLVLDFRAGRLLLLLLRPPPPQQQQPPLLTLRA